jgi:hypothetical protein
MKVTIAEMRTELQRRGEDVPGKRALKADYLAALQAADNAENYGNGAFQKRVNTQGGGGGRKRQRKG